MATKPQAATSSLSLARLRELERRYDGPIPAEELAGGPLPYRLARARAHCRALAAEARRQLAILRDLRRRRQRDTRLDGARRDLELYLRQRRRWRAELRRLQALAGSDTVDPPTVAREARTPPKREPRS